MFVPTPLWPETSRFRQTEKTGCVMSPWQFEALFSSEMFAVYNTLHVAVELCSKFCLCGQMMYCGLYVGIKKQLIKWYLSRAAILSICLPVYIGTFSYS